MQAPMFGDYIEAFHHDLTDVVQFTGVAILVLGFSNFIWYALSFRKFDAPTIIITCLPKGTYPNLFWQTASPHSLDDYLLRQQYLEGEGKQL
jgi:hypothetical protein